MARAVHLLQSRATAHNGEVFNRFVYALRMPHPTVEPFLGAALRIEGTVQGVGFRPAIWRLATELGLSGRVGNDGGGVWIEVWGTRYAIDCFIERLPGQAPPLACIERITRLPAPIGPAAEDFRIVASATGAVRTAVAPDAAVCGACLTEVNDPTNRRYRYAFTNCTQCGPRLSIVRGIPYDRANTSMAAFILCPECQHEYARPEDRRFHAQPNACPVCGPTLWLEDAAGQRLDVADPITATAARIRAGHIIAIKGIGGIHLACDAQDAAAIARLRARKRRYHKAFAVMARDPEMVARYARLSSAELAMLQHRAAPVVLLAAAGQALADGVAPGQHRLGFMLPYTPLHHLLLRELTGPIVLTSGNYSDAPQCIDNDAAREQLSEIADYFLLHDRAILNRLDDSVLHLADGQPRVLRRARGYAPSPLPLPPGFEHSPDLLALGGELKSTFCLLKDGQAILSQHLGDLEDATTFREYRQHLQLYRELLQHHPRLVAVDRHPDYLSSQYGQSLAAAEQLPLSTVQHHHAHIAACLAEHRWPLEHPPVLGIALDGLGLGDDDTLWGGEFLWCDYRTARRLAGFPPVPMPGGSGAIRAPWRNTYAHLRHSLGWAQTQVRYRDTELLRYFTRQPIAQLERMLIQGFNCPSASSCGRLFDAAAAAIGVCRDAASYEGQPACELEALAAPYFETERDHRYGYDYQPPAAYWTLSWRRLWRGLLDDLSLGVPPARIAARFHHTVADAVAGTAIQLCTRTGTATVALGGGAWQNRLLLEETASRLRQAGITVLAPADVPANDGGLALGQAVVAAARWSHTATASHPTANLWRRRNSANSVMAVTSFDWAG